MSLMIGDALVGSFNERASATALLLRERVMFTFTCIAIYICLEKLVYKRNKLSIKYIFNVGIRYGIFGLAVSS
ncbi:hypothetical protein A7K95_06315 [Pediococcus parvulus]|uniref:Uncharacterized protein n=1 Tax=Pediococcus parvulus TaxID=54062 RepID=A0ABX2UFY2_9LACO|nr:hypothetical protein A7K95_06315 [Pediococcus parvulus]